MAATAGAATLKGRTMSLTATARSIPGTLRQEVVIDGKHRLITDEPERLGGDGSAPAPHELFPAALASCVSTTLVMYARTKGWELGGVSVAVDYDNRSTPRRFDVAVELGGELTDAQLARLEKVAASCPVRRSVETGIEFHETITCCGRPLVASGDRP
jgi:putative redox protein